MKEYSFRNKFVYIEDSVIKLFDVFLVLQRKLDHTFPKNQFRINGYKIFRCDRNRFVVVLVVHMNQHIPRSHYNKTRLFLIFKIFAIEFYQNN